MKDSVSSMRLYQMETASAGKVLSWFLRRKVCALSLLMADIAAFALAGFLFRSFGARVPEVILYRGLLPFQVAIDLFYLFGFFFLVVRVFAGDYGRRQLFWDEARQTTQGLILAAIPSLLVRIFSAAEYSIIPDMLSWGFVIIAVPLCRQGMRLLLKKVHFWQMPTVLIGSGDKIIDAYRVFKSSLSLGFDVRLQVSIGDDTEARDIAGVTRIGLRHPANIIRRLGNAGCRQAVVVTDQLSDEQINSLIEQLMSAGITVAVIPQIRRLPLLGMQLNYFFGKDIFLIQVRNNIGRLPSRILKRVMDLLGSLCLLILLSPVFAAISLMIKREGGKVFFVQSRVGQNGKEFPCVKFRSMRADAESMLARWKKQNSPIYQEYVASNFKLHNDPRVTRIGKFLRKTSLDELPQLFNVLMGEMSLVGPRPLLAREISDYGVTISLYRQLRPGMTGMWQISGRSHTTFAERASADEWYVKNWSLWYDIVILFKTVDVLIHHDDAY